MKFVERKSTATLLRIAVLICVSFRRFRAHLNDISPREEVLSITTFSGTYHDQSLECVPSYFATLYIVLAVLGKRIAIK